MLDILGPSISYVDALDIQTFEATKQLEEDLRQGEKPAYNPLRPSSSGRCTRELAYALREYTQKDYYNKEPIEPNVTRLLSLGHAIEPHLMDQFKKYLSEYVKIKYEQQSVYAFEVYSEEVDELNHLVEGSLDWCFILDDHKGIIDLKTKKDKFHRFHKSDWDATDEKLREMQTVVMFNESTKAYWVPDVEAFLEELNEPFFEANFWQLNLYANTDWAKRIGIDHAAIIQYNKNDSRTREVRFKPSRGLYDRTAEKFQKAVNAVSKDNIELAPRDHSLGSIKCAFCPYNEACWSKTRERVKGEFFATFPKKKWPKNVGRMNEKLSKALEANYAKYKKTKKLVDELSKVEQNIVKLLEENKVDKVEFSDGHVYETRYLKTPYPHLALRRTKK